jgi:hypothetical protein
MTPDDLPEYLTGRPFILIAADSWLDGTDLFAFQVMHSPVLSKTDVGKVLQEIVNNWDDMMETEKAVNDAAASRGETESGD